MILLFGWMFEALGRISYTIVCKGRAPSQGVTISHRLGYDAWHFFRVRTSLCWYIQTISWCRCLVVLLVPLIELPKMLPSFSLLPNNTSALRLAHLYWLSLHERPASAKRLTLVSSWNAPRLIIALIWNWNKIQAEIISVWQWLVPNRITNSWV